MPQNGCRTSLCVFILSIISFLIQRPKFCFSPVLLYSIIFTFHVFCCIFPVLAAGFIPPGIKIHIPAAVIGNSDQRIFVMIRKRTHCHKSRVRQTFHRLLLQLFHLRFFPYHAVFQLKTGVPAAHQLKHVGHLFHGFHLDAVRLKFRRLRLQPPVYHRRHRFRGEKSNDQYPHRQKRGRNHGSSFHKRPPFNSAMTFVPLPSWLSKCREPL